MLIHRYAVIIYVFLWAIFYPSFSYSHPHVYVKVGLVANFRDKDMDLLSLTEMLSFDEMTSASIMESVDKNRNNKLDADEVLILKKSFLEMAINIGFYTKIFLNDDTLVPPEIFNFKAVYKEGLVVYVFDIIFPKPINIYKNMVNVSIYDESFYTKMEYISKPLNITISGKQANCAYSIFKDSKNTYYYGAMVPETIRICRKK